VLDKFLKNIIIKIESGPQAGGRDFS